MTKEEYIELNKALTLICNKMNITDEFGDMVEDFYTSDEVKEDLSKYTPEEVVTKLLTNEYRLCAKIFGIEEPFDDDEFDEVTTDDELIAYIKRKRK
jgi:hypothetical protein